MHNSDKNSAYLEAMGIPLWKRRAQSVRFILITPSSLPQSLLFDLQHCCATLQHMMHTELKRGDIQAGDHAVFCGCEQPDWVNFNTFYVNSLDKPEAKQQLWLTLCAFNDDY